jgi:Haem-binding domain
VTRVLKLGAIALGVFLVVAQAFRIGKANPPVTADLSAPAPAKEVLRRSCYGCHSNETVWPWYSDVASASWLVTHDVHQGRAELNFSQWGTYRSAQRLKKLKQIGEEIAEGDMPPSYYIYPMHLSARLSAADHTTTTNWLASESAAARRATR